MIFVTRIETVSLAEIPPPCFLTSGFIQCQYPLTTYVSLLMHFTHRIYKRSYIGRRQRRLSTSHTLELLCTPDPAPSEQQLLRRAPRLPLFASTPQLAPPP